MFQTESKQILQYVCKFLGQNITYFLRNLNKKSAKKKTANLLISYFSHYEFFAAINLWFMLRELFQGMVSTSRTDMRFYYMRLISYLANFLKASCGSENLTNTYFNLVFYKRTLFKFKLFSTHHHFIIHRITFVKHSNDQKKTIHLHLNFIKRRGWMIKKIVSTK